MHFDTAKNQVLAAGDNHQIKFWDMRNSKFVSSTDIREGLPVRVICQFTSSFKYMKLCPLDFNSNLLLLPRYIHILDSIRTELF